MAKQFAFILGYSKAFPARLPEFYNYLLSYPNSKPTNTDDAFYLGEDKVWIEADPAAARKKCSRVSTGLRRVAPQVGGSASGVPA